MPGSVKEQFWTVSGSVKEPGSLKVLGSLKVPYRDERKSRAKNGKTVIFQKKSGAIVSILNWKGIIFLFIHFLSKLPFFV